MLSFRNKGSYLFCSHHIPSVCGHSGNANAHFVGRPVDGWWVYIPLTRAQSSSFRWGTGPCILLLHVAWFLTAKVWWRCLLLLEFKGQRVVPVVAEAGPVLMDGRWLCPLWEMCWLVSVGGGQWRGERNILTCRSQWPTWEPLQVTTECLLWWGRVSCLSGPLQTRPEHSSSTTRPAASAQLHFWLVDGLAN